MHENGVLPGGRDARGVCRCWNVSVLAVLGEMHCIHRRSFTAFTAFRGGLPPHCSNSHTKHDDLVVIMVMITISLSLCALDTLLFGAKRLSARIVLCSYAQGDEVALALDKVALS